MTGKTDRNNGSNTADLGSDGKFARGNSGRPKGARPKATQAIEVLLEGQGAALTQKAIDMALEGDTTALRLCLERIAPSRKDSPVRFELPDIQSAQDAADAARAILRAVADGDITPQEAVGVMAVVEQLRRTLETSELEKRIATLEDKK